MRILLVEDDRETREFLKASLKHQTFAVDSTGDGAQGSYLARVNDYDLILLDNNLPSKNGPDICMDIRKIGKMTPILMLSVINDVTTRINLLNIGVDDYMSKPFSFEEVLARVRALLRRPPILEENNLKVADLSINTVRQSVMRGDKGIYLTKKQFSLLEYLMKNKGKVLSRSMILEHVWDDESDPFSNTLEAHILNLRKKIRCDNTCKELIYNIPGRGYKIDEKE